MSKSPITKKLMIESQSSNGKCYVRLLSMTPNFANCPTYTLENAIIYMVQSLGKNPKGSVVLPLLWMCNRIMEGVWTFEPTDKIEDIHKIDYKSFMDQMFNSTMRYSWEEIGGVQHIGSYIDSHKNTPEVWTELGYSARYVLCMLVNPGCRVGSEMNFSGLFDRIQEEGLQEYQENEDKKFYDSGLASENDELRSNLNDRLHEIEKLNRQMRDLQRKVTQTSNHQRSPQLDDQTIGMFSKLLETQMKLKENKNGDDLEPLEPNDSSSVFSRYEKKRRFMNPGTVFDIQKDPYEDLDEADENTSLTVQPLTKPTVLGYQKTKQMVLRENQMLQKVSPINGLANPFHSHRLNLLCHIDTAMKSIQLRKEDYTHYDIIIWISEHKSQTPSQELLYQVVSFTFDLKNSVVVANPYKLPFIEIGMIISDDSLVKCFNLLRLEFKALWFDKMKSIIVPDFHNEFLKYKEYKLSKSSQQTKTVKFQSSNNNHSNQKQQNSKRTGTSILSILK